MTLCAYMEIATCAVDRAAMCGLYFQTGVRFSGGNARDDSPPCPDSRPGVMVSKVTCHDSEEFDFPAVCIVFLGERAKHLFIFRNGGSSERDDENGFAVNHRLLQVAPK